MPNPSVYIKSPGESSFQAWKQSSETPWSYSMLKLSLTLVHCGAPYWTDFFLLISQQVLNGRAQNSTRLLSITWRTFTCINVLDKRDGHQVING